MKEICANVLAIKEVNTNLIRKVLRKEKRATKQRLSEMTGLSIVTVGSILNSMMLTKEVYEDELVPSNGGRPAHSYCFNKNYQHVLVIYTYEQEGNNKYSASIVNLFGELIETKSQEFIMVQLESFEPVIDYFLKKYQTIKAIAFGLPGMEFHGIMVVNDYKNLSDTSFTMHYQEKYHLPVLMENDLNAAAMGYYVKNQGRDTNIAYLYFPRQYCPGAGIIINGSLLHGNTNFAGEISNIPFGVDWSHMDYNQTNLVLPIIAKIIVSIACIVNPEKVIIHGEFLSEKDLILLNDLCKEMINPVFVPDISLSENFIKDYEQGIIYFALSLIEQDLVLLK